MSVPVPGVFIAKFLLSPILLNKLSPRILMPSMMWLLLSEIIGNQLLSLFFKCELARPTSFDVFHELAKDKTERQIFHFYNPISKYV